MPNSSVTSCSCWTGRRGIASDNSWHGVTPGDDFFKSQVKDDATVLKQLLRKTFLTTQFYQEAIQSAVSGTDLFAVALVFVLAPCQWDLVPYRFQSSASEIDNAEIVRIQKVNTVDRSPVEIVVHEMEQRARVLAKSVFFVAPENADDQLHKLSSLVFALLLRMYFSDEGGVQQHIQRTLPTLFWIPALSVGAPCLRSCLV